MLRRQPLRDTTPNTGSRMRRTNHVEDGANPRSYSAKKSPRKKIPAAGIENDSPPKKRTPKKSKSENSKSRVQVLLGGMFDRLQRPSSSRSSSGSSASLRVEDIAASTHYEEQSLEKRKRKSVGVHDGSLATVLTEMETSSPLLDESFVVDVRVVEEAQPTAEELAEIWKEKQRVAATLLQSLFRGYRQRYEFHMLLLRLKLKYIQANKERQLNKLVERTKTRKRQEKSVSDFHNPAEKTARQLQKVARIVPYLFREAQTNMRENIQLASSSQEVQELQESHMNLKKLAHSYLESLEDLPNIWEALKAQWMGPKKLPIRRSFLPDGKIVKQRVLKQQYNTHDDDLPVDSDEEQPYVSRPASDLPQEHTNFVNLFVQACAHEIYSTDDDVDQAVEQFQEAVGKSVWN